ncbi:MAG: hypothetical protein CL897_04675 [Dehalococcoidia bacterium]|nr:hypothetical protein [Dehalococcoidia bacterium]HCV00295.1 hypothetical protein [Dehalococcoidia bacterium]|tara:strand:+ start:2416 stop:4080 length:1665 start_codon:yes stop_codon:yes gene_type:complete
MLNGVAGSRLGLVAVALLGAGAVAAVILGVLLFLSDRDRSYSPLASTGPKQAVYVEGIVGTWQRINPLFSDGNPVDEDLSRLVFAGLLRVGEDGRLLPDLAPLPEVGEDGRTYTFRLHRDLRWHDGIPVRSLDVAFTIDQILAADFQGDPRLKAAWTGVEVQTPDLRTIIIRLPATNATFLARFATVGILPQHLLQGLDGTALFDSPFNTKPVGAGPYRLDSITSIEANLSANPRYHLGRPQIDLITMRFLPDLSEVRQALQVGEIDGIFLRQNLSQDQIDELAVIDGFVSEDLQRAVSLVLYLNNNQAAYFRDSRVRTAVSLALDRETLVVNALGGLAVPSSSLIAPGTWAYEPSLDSPPSDVEMALALLAEVGWRPSPTTGVLIRQGSEFRLTIRTDNDAKNLALAREIARQLEPIGIRATVASTSFAVLNRDFLSPRTYDAALAGWDQGADPDPYFAWHSSQLVDPGANIANYGSIVFDALLERGRTTSNMLVRLDAYRQIQELWPRETPSVILAYPSLRYIRATSVMSPAFGVLFSPTDRFLNVHLWNIQ